MPLLNKLEIPTPEAKYLYNQILEEVDLMKNVMQNGDGHQGEYEALSKVYLRLSTLKHQWSILLSKSVRLKELYHVKALTAKKAQIAKALEEEEGLSHSKSLEVAAGVREYIDMLKKRSEVYRDHSFIEGTLELINDNMTLASIKMSGLKNKW